MKASAAVRRRGESERGSGTALALGLIVVLAAVAYILAAFAAAFSAHQRAGAAADLAALAAAQTLNDPFATADPCEVAERISEVPLASCTIVGNMVDVQAVDTVPFGAFEGRQMVGRAQAGPF